LAQSLTGLTHGKEGLASAMRASEVFFGAAIQDIDDAQLGEIFADVPSRTMPRPVLEAGLPLIDAVVASGLSKSKGEGRRKIEEGGVYVNNVRATTTDQRLGVADLASKTILVLRLGRKNYALLKFD
jgi:tyrosyl-tRNA synthetase